MVAEIIQTTKQMGAGKLSFMMDFHTGVEAIVRCLSTYDLILSHLELLNVNYGVQGGGGVRGQRIIHEHRSVPVLYGRASILLYM